MNKFTQATIKTYNKKNPILASKHTLGSFQVIFCIKFFKTKFILKPFITSTIYIYIYIGLSSHCAKEDIPSPTQKKKFLQHKRKNEQKQVRHLCFLANLELNLHSNRSYFISSFFFFSSSFLLFSKHVHTNINFSHSFMRFLYASISRLQINEILSFCVTFR